MSFLAPVVRKPARPKGPLAWAVVSLGWMVLGFGTAGAAQTPLDRAGAVKLLEKYCQDCHADGARKGEVDLDELLASSDPGGRSAEWLKTWKIVRHGFMPPAGRDAPSATEREALANWMAREHLGVDFERPDPGRVTLRRLNRLEYEYSVQDLFGADFSAEQDYSSDLPGPGGAALRLRDRLPPDETAFGFDNIGDFLTLPPALLERYFDIAEFVVGRVVVVDGPRSPARWLPPDGFRREPDPGPGQSRLSIPVEIERAGTYRVEIQFTLGGWQEYGGSHEFTAQLDGAEVARELLEVGGYKTHRHSTEKDLAAGAHSLTLSTAARKPDSKGTLAALRLTPRIRVVGPLGPAHLEYPEPHRRLFFRGEAPPDAAGRRSYAREILERVAARAFRRPVEAGSLDRLVELAGKNPQFERGIAQALSAILTSPRFLFRAETQPRPDDPAEVHPLDEHALASRLSYLLWLSLPDDELRRLADRGELRRGLRTQVARMLADPKSARFFEDFPGQWLRTRNVLMTPLSTRDADRVNPVRGSMKRETELLFEHLAREDRDLVELITADYTFVDRALANYYKLPEVPEGGFHRVKLPPESHRGGLLTHGSFLVATSNPNRTSPVKRGLFILENLLGIEPPPPPPNVPALDDVNLGDTGRKSGRELLALHRENKSCAACHAHFDPLGVALENFDVLGRWRDTEEGRPIEPQERTVTGETLGGVADVRALFARQKERFYRGITEKLLTYALGRGLEPADSVTVDAVAQRVAAEGGKFSTLLLGVVESPAFQRRRGDGGGTKAAQRSAVPPIPPPEKRRPPKRPATNAVPAKAGAGAAGAILPPPAAVPVNPSGSKNP